MLDSKAKSNGLWGGRSQLRRSETAIKKLRMDCIVVLRLPVRKEEPMNDHPADESTAELIPRLFAILTAKLEDGAAIAVEGQARGLTGGQYCEAAGRLIALGQEIAAVAEAIERLSSPPHA